MHKSVVCSMATEQGAVGRRKNKSRNGCGTCRTRKIKCDENKPSCRKCVDTGRTCDGYKSRFRYYVSQVNDGAHPGRSKPAAGSQPIWSMLPDITPQDIDLLNRCFSTKTLFDVDLGCSEEARQVLQASLADPAIRHAISSLMVLRQDLETSGDDPAKTTSSYDSGLQQYCRALRGLASNLASQSPRGLKSALYCCQIFISIEQVRKNYTAMGQHIIQGLRIMHEYRARPCLTVTNQLVPAYHEQLPLLDLFIIKLFAAPCKFAEPPSLSDKSEESIGICPVLLPAEPNKLRIIVPDKRTELTKISASTIGFLDKISHVQSAEDALGLLSEKTFLLESLNSWLHDLECGHTKDKSPEAISVSFLRLFHQILKVVLMGSLRFPSDVGGGLRGEYERLQGVASHVGQRVKGYRAFNVSENPQDSVE